MPVVPSEVLTWRTPRDDDLGLRRIASEAGLAVSVLRNGALLAIEHRGERGSVLVNQVLASPLDGGIGTIVLRCGGPRPANIETVGARATVALGVAPDRIVWEGLSAAVRHRVTLRLLAHAAAWVWRVEATNAGDAAVPIDAICVQDLGLGARGFVSNNEAYASQYIDHHIARHPRHGPVVMSRQNLAQQGAHPWLMQGCVEGAHAFATDALQLFGPAHRDANDVVPPFGTALADRRLQHEAACVALQSLPLTLQPGATAAWHFFAFFEPDHPAASSDDDLARLAGMAWIERDRVDVAVDRVSRSVVQDACVAGTATWSREAVSQRYPERMLEEFDGDALVSFFTPIRRSTGTSCCAPRSSR